MLRNDFSNIIKSTTSNIFLLLAILIFIKPCYAKDLDKCFQKIYLKAIKKDFRDGCFEKYKKERIIYRVHLKNGLLDGDAEIFHKNGIIKEKAFYQDDVLSQSYIITRKNGQLKSRFEIKNGNKNGTAEFFNKQGILIKKFNYSNNKLNGEFKKFYKNGSLKALGFYKNDKLEGLLQTYYRSGAIASEDHYSLGKLNGLSRYFTPGGAIFYQQRFINGEIIGSQALLMNRNFVWEPSRSKKCQYQRSRRSQYTRFQRSNSRFK